MRWRLALASFVAAASAFAFFALRLSSPAAPVATQLPTGMQMTPLAAPGAIMQRLVTGLRADGSADASGAMATALSPDEKTLLVETSGYNYQYYQPNGREIQFPLRDPLTGAISHKTSNLTQWVFVYRVDGDAPKMVQRIAIPNAFVGLAWAPDGSRFYVSGGVDDRVLVYARRGRSFVFDAPAVLLGHDSHGSAAQPDYDGGLLSKTPAGGNRAKALSIVYGAIASGLAVSKDGTLAVANMQNDSVSFVDMTKRKVTAEVALYSPGGREAHGEYPYGVAIVSSMSGAAATTYVSSLRDGDIAVVRGGRVERFIDTGGAPNALALSTDGTKLYAANGGLDEIDVIDTATGVLARRISLDRPSQRFRGASPNGIALDDDGKRLYVTLGGENAVAVVDLTSGSVAGRIPTGWYPTALSFRSGRLFVSDAKGPAGPNRGLDANVAIVGSKEKDPRHGDWYVLDLEKANLLSFAVPSGDDLATLSADVDANNGFGRPASDPTMDALRGKIKHVIFVMKENRTYDQVLGDLPGADGDPRLNAFPYAIAPNHHELARQFVTFDNFYTAGDVSNDGWPWTTQGRANEYTARVTPISYASDGFTFDGNGVTRNVNTAFPIAGGRNQFDARVTTLLDPSGRSAMLPGSKDVAADDGDSDDAADATGGFIWDAVIRSGKTVRHYGMYTDETYYKMGAPFYIPIVRNAYAKRAPQSPPVRPSLLGRTDVYYRGWDLNAPDRYRFEEWKREFDGYVARGDLPAFEPMVLMMDHFGNFGTNVAGLNTPYLQMADNDYALGRLVETIARSRYWKDTAIFVLEDDSQDGPDHVDAHRSVAYAISAYTRRHAVVHHRYSTVSMLRTIEDLLGISPLGMFDANAEPMSAAFLTSPDTDDRYRAILPGSLCRKPVRADLIPECSTADRVRTVAIAPRRSAAWWIAQTKGMDFDHHDAMDPEAFNALLEAGL
jgi:YVTN family beta-propeller protein